MNTNTKKITLLGLYSLIGIFLVGTVVVLFLFNSKQPKQNNTPAPTLTPFPNIQNNDQGIQILSTSPTNNATDISPDTTINFIFNQQATDIPFSISPNFPYTKTLEGNTITLHPTQPLLLGTKYSIILNLGTKNGSYNLYNYGFSTIGPTPTKPPTQFDPTLQQNINDFQRTNHPDVFLSNHIPYSGASFSVTDDFVAGSPSGHWHFTVQTVASNNNQAKSDFITWAESLGLTSAQVQSLDITYQ